MSGLAHATAMAQLQRRVAQLERRLENTVRHGVVREVNVKDKKKPRVRLMIGKDANGTEQLSPWIAYQQHGADYKHHAPPTKGMSMTIFAPGGDLRQAVAVALTFSEAHESPSDKPDEHVITYAKSGEKSKDTDLKEVRRYNERIFTVGKVSIHMRPDDKDEVHIAVGKQKIRIHEGGIEALTDEFLHTGPNGSGGVVRHNTLNIGDSHRHRDVMPGAGETGIPKEV